MMLSDVCLSVAYIGPKSRTKRPWKTKIGTASHVTRTPLSRSKGQRSRSPGCFAHRHVGTSRGCSGGHGNMLAVGKCCYVAVCCAALTGEERGGAFRGGRPPTAC